MKPEREMRRGVKVGLSQRALKHAIRADCLTLNRADVAG